MTVVEISWKYKISIFNGFKRFLNLFLGSCEVDGGVILGLRVVQRLAVTEWCWGRGRKVYGGVDGGVLG